jgi:uncharacterized RDD family membrane protein YckC
MDSGRIDSIKNELSSIETKDLFDIWKKNDRRRWSSEAFEAISSILTDRGVDLNLFEIPDQLDEASNVFAYAGFWKRFAASFVDSFVLGFIQFLVFFFLALSFHTKIDFSAKQIPLHLNLTIQAIGLLIAWLYFAGMESSDRQATYGKSLLRIKVTDLEGNRISFMKATTRFIAKFISQITLLVGYLMAGFTPKKQALHDMMAQCLVIED